MARISLFWSETTTKVFLSHKDDALEESGILRLRSGKWKLKSVFERMFAPHCSSSFPTLNPHVLDSLLDRSERFRKFLCTGSEPFEHFHVLVKIYYRVKARSFRRECMIPWRT